MSRSPHDFVRDPNMGGARNRDDSVHKWARRAVDTLDRVPTPMPTPATPLPVYNVETAPLWWSGEWWIVAGIPVAGIVASVLLSLLAIRYTRTLQIREDRERERSGRALFALAVDAYLDPGLDERRANNSAVRLFMRRENRLRHAAVAAGGDAPDIAEWILRESATIFEHNAVRSFAPDVAGEPMPNHAHDILFDVASWRVRQWVQTGDIDTSPIDYVEEAKEPM